MDGSQRLNDLVYKIGGDVSPFEKAMKDLDRRAEQSARKAGSAFAKTGETIASAGRTMATRFLGPLSAGALVYQVQSTLRQTIDMVNELDASARTAGVGFETFQELKYAAERNLVGVDALADGLKEMQLRIDEVLTTGSGAAKDALSALGFTAEELAEKLKKPDLLFEEIIERLRSFEKAAQIRLADELFGGSAGEQFVRLLDVGASRLSDLREEGRRLGLVFSEEIQQAVRDANGELNHMGAIVTSIANHARQKLLNVFLDIVDSFREMENWTQTNLNDEYISAAARRREIEKDILETLDQQAWLIQHNQIAEAKVLDAKISKRREEAQELDAIMEKIIRIENIRKQGSEGTGGGSYTPPERKADPDKRGARSSGVSSIERERAAVDALIASLTHELSLVGATELEKAKLNALRQAGANATDEQRKKIEGLVTALHEEREAARLAEEAQRQRATALDNLFQMGADGITSVLDKSVKAEDAVKKLVAQLAMAAIQAKLLGTGPLAGLFGSSLFGGSSFTANTTASAFFGAFGAPGFASGTANTGGRRGEPRGVVHGQEAVIPLPDGGKVPVEMILPRVPDIMAHHVGPTDVTFNMSVVVSGNGDKELMDRMRQGAEIQIQEALRSYDLEIAPITVHRVINDPHSVG